MTSPRITEQQSVMHTLPSAANGTPADIMELGAPSEGQDPLPKMKSAFWCIFLFTACSLMVTE